MPVHEGEPVVIVLDVERGSQLLGLRVSLDEAEGARVRTAPDQIGFGHEPERFRAVLFDLVRDVPAAGQLGFQFHELGGFQVLEIEGVTQLLAVEAEKTRAHLDVEVGPDGASADLCDPDHSGAQVLANP